MVILSFFIPFIREFYSFVFPERILRIRSYAQSAMSDVRDLQTLKDMAEITRDYEVVMEYEEKHRQVFDGLWNVFFMACADFYYSLAILVGFIVWEEARYILFVLFMSCLCRWIVTNFLLLGRNAQGASIIMFSFLNMGLIFRIMTL